LIRTSTGKERSGGTCYSDFITGNKEAEESDQSESESSVERLIVILAHYNNFKYVQTICLLVWSKGD
jgi:hypothetical protein